MTVLLALVLPLAAPGEARGGPAQEDQKSRSLGEKVLVFTLDNGWRFLLLSRQEVPAISFETCVATGPAHEPPGASGVTPLIQRLLFSGSERVGSLDWPAEQAALEAVAAAREALEAARGEPEPVLAPAEEALQSARALAASLADQGEYRRILENAGGGATLGAHLSAEETHFVVSLPSNRLELWCWMEAERFSRPVMRGFDAEREALREDRARYLEDPPKELLREALRTRAWAGIPGYGDPLGGFPEDLARLTRESTMTFFQASYGARSTTTAIVGDFDPAALMPLLERYFAKLPDGEPLELPVPPESPSSDAGRIEIEAGAPSQVMLGWRVPPLGHEDRPAIELAVRLLGEARSSRLRRLLVRERSIAVELEVTPSSCSSHLGGLALIHAVPVGGVKTARLEELIHQAIAELAREGPEPAELDGAQRAIEAEHLRLLRDNASIAAGLIEYQLQAGDWSRFFDGPRLAKAVTARDIRRVLSAYFTPEKCVVATLIQTEEG